MWAIAMGGLALLGYGLGAQILVRPAPGSALMTPLTAVAFITAGAGLGLLSSGNVTVRRAGQVLGVLVAVYGAAVLAEYVAGRGMGFDLILFPGRVRAWADNNVPGRASPYSAVMFLLIGLALALLDVDPGHRHRPARALTLATALAAFVAFLGYFFDLGDLRHGSDGISGMALGSAVSFVILALGVLACRPDRPPARAFCGDGAGATMLRRIVPVVTAALFLAVLASALASPDTGKELILTAAAAIIGVALYLVYLRTDAALDRADRALRDERDFSQTVLGSLSEGVITIGPDGAVLQVNSRWCEITGLSAQEAVGLKPPYPWWPTEHAADLSSLLATVTTANSSVESDILIRHRDGTEAEVLSTATAVRDDDGGLRMVVGAYRDVTERNRTEARRQRAAEQLDHFFAISTDLLCIAGTDGYFKRLNPAFERALGYTAAELLAKPYVEYTHPDDVDRTNAETAEQAAHGKATMSFENRYRCRDGSYRWLSWNATPSPGSDLVYAAARDTTQVREVERTRALLAAIVDGSDDAIIGKNLDGIILSWNQGAQRTYGYTPQEAIGQPIGLIAPPERAGEIETIMESIARGEPVRCHDTIRMRKDGTRVHVAVTISPVRDLSGTMVGAAAIARDITARVKAEQRFSRLVMAAPDAMVIVDSGGRIVLVNEQTERLFGYPAAELAGQPVEMLVPHKLRGLHVHHRDDYLAAPQIRRMGTGLELSGLRRDGSEFPIEISLSPLDTDEGSMASASIRDISERREAERALAGARDEALAATRLKSQFVAMVSHEIRTPMNGVIGVTALLLETPLQPTQRRYAQAIRSSGRALLTIINDILDFSKIEAGKIELVEADFELDKLIESVIQVAAEAGRDKDVEVACYYPPALQAAVRGDDGRLRQILLNLLGNAVKFTEHGELALRATPAAPTPDGRAQVTFAVTDTGIGIASDDLHLLFEPFAQVDAASNRQFGGTGLGLPITRQLIVLMGGQLDVRSEPGHGSQFSFTIPLTPQPGSPAQRIWASSLSARRLLIVDHNPASRQLLSEHAKAWGIEAEAVPDGDSALEHLRSAFERHEPYAVAIIDQQIPDLNGVHLSRQIMEDPAFAAVKLVMLTSGSYQEEEAGISAGAAAVLPKPVCPSQIYNCLLSLLDPDAAKASQQEDSPLHHPVRGDRGLILLAEDNEINQMVAAENLSMLGYRVDIARNGVEAVRLAAVKPYLAVLMDCQMPTMDGFTATAQLRAQELPDQHIPIIAMTAGALAEDKQRCLDAGMDDYLTKPIDPDQLRAALIRWAGETYPSPTPGA